MQDVKHEMNDDGLFCISRSGRDLVTVDGFECALLVSLLTNARLPESVAQKPFSRGGWLGNIRTAKNNRELGGKGYSVDISRMTQDTLNNAREYAYKSLEWMLQDKICRSIDVKTEAVKQKTIQYTVTITARDGLKYNYVYLWGKTNAFTHSLNFNA